MRTLYLVRHAKSDRAIEHLSDIDRPLNSRGYADAQKMSAVLKEKNIFPGLVISSPAVRAISTALIFCRNLNYDPKKILIDKTLYDTGVKDYLNCISKIDAQYEVVFLFGHNPTITGVLNKLTSMEKDDMPTCCIAGVSSEQPGWPDFIKHKNALSYFNFPKNLL